MAGAMLKIRCDQLLVSTEPSNVGLVDRCSYDLLSAFSGALCSYNYCCPGNSHRVVEAASHNTPCSGREQVVGWNFRWNEYSYLVIAGL